MVGGRSYGLVKPPAGTQIDLGHPFAQGLIGCWPFNEGSGRVSRNLVTGRVGSVSGSTLNWAATPGGVGRNSTTRNVSVSDTYAHRTYARDNFTIIARCVFRVFAGGTSNISAVWSGNSSLILRMGDAALTSGQLQGVIGITKLNDPETLVEGVVYNLAMRSAQNEMALFVNTRKAAVGPTGGAGGGDLTTEWFSDAAGGRAMNGAILMGLLYDRTLSDDDIRGIAEAPYSMYLPPVTQRSWFLPSSSRVGTGTLLAQTATDSGAGTHTAPTYRGTGVLVAQTAAQAASGITTTPTYHGTGTPAGQAATDSGTGTHTAPTYHGSGTPSAQTAVDAGTGTHVVPTYHGSGTPSSQVAADAGTGTHAAPVYSGTGTPLVQAVTPAAAGTHAGPVYAGSAAVSLQAAAWSAAGTFVVPTYAGTGTPSTREAAHSATGVFFSTYSGTGTPTPDEAAASGTATHTAPVYAGLGDPVLPETAWATAGTFDVPVYAGTGTPTLDGAAADGVGNLAGTYVGGGGVACEEAACDGTGTSVTVVEIPQTGFAARFRLTNEERLYWPDGTQPAEYPGRVTGIACVQTGRVTFSTDGGSTYRQKHLVAGSVYRPARVVTNFDFPSCTAAFYVALVR